MKNTPSPADWYRMVDRHIDEIQQQAVKLLTSDSATFNLQHDDFVRAMNDLASASKTMSGLLARMQR